MNDTDKRQFLDKLYLLNVSDEFSVSYFDALRGYLTFEEIRELLNDRRIKYNVALVDLLKEFSIVIPDLHKKLDEFWEDLTEDDILQAISRGGFRRVVFPLPLDTLGMTVYCYSAKKKFEDYKMQVLNLVEENLEVIHL